MSTQNTGLRFQAISEAIGSGLPHHFYWSDEAVSDQIRSKVSHVWVFSHEQDGLEIWSDSYHGWMVLLDGNGQVIGKSKSGIIVTDTIIAIDKHIHSTDEWIYYRKPKADTVMRALETAVDEILTGEIMPAVYTIIDQEAMIETIANQIRAKYEAIGALYDA